MKRLILALFVTMWCAAISAQELNQTYLLNTSDKALSKIEKQQKKEALKINSQKVKELTAKNKETIKLLKSMYQPKDIMSDIYRVIF